MTTRLLVIALALFVLGRQQAATTQTETVAQPQTRVRFTQEMSMRRPADAQAQPVKVALRDWIVRNRQTLSVKTTGMLVMQMRAGETIVVTVNGQRSERKENEYFTVPADAALTIQTSDDTAVLTVLEVQQ